MKKIIITLLLAFSFFISGQSIELSDSLRISVLTVSPGNELYSTFGHTAIRLTDLRQGFDIVFNYGTFDFRTPNFYIKFALGKLDYLLSVESFDGFIEAAMQENRSIVEQELNLPRENNIRLAMLLIENYQPQNRAYRYKFFTDNCATRVRDILVKATACDSLLIKSAVNTNLKFRTLYTSYLKTMPWSRFGTELLLGSMTDKVSGYDALFLPDNLKTSIEKAVLYNNSFVKKETQLFAAKAVKDSTNWFTPIIMSIFILLLTFLIQLKKGWTVIFDRVFFGIFGILGLFITAMAIFSNHHEVQSNWVVLFLLPTNIILTFINSLKFRQLYSMTAFGLLVLSFMCLPFIPQSFNVAVLILSVATVVRLFFNFSLSFSTYFSKK